MATFNVPTLSDGTARYDQTTELDGVFFRLYFDFNEYDGFWYLTIRTEADTQIVGCEGIRLAANSWPIRRAYDPNRPQGEFYVLSESGQEAGINDLGDSVILSYIPIADMEDLF
jgi:hypothetical protein